MLLHIRSALSLIVGVLCSAILIIALCIVIVGSIYVLNFYLEEWADIDLNERIRHGIQNISKRNK